MGKDREQALDAGTAARLCGIWDRGTKGEGIKINVSGRAGSSCVDVTEGICRWVWKTSGNTHGGIALESDLGLEGDGVLGSYVLLAQVVELGEVV